MPMFRMFFCAERTQSVQVFHFRDVEADDLTEAEGRADAFASLITPADVAKWGEDHQGSPPIVQESGDPYVLEVHQIVPNEALADERKPKPLPTFTERATGIKLTPEELHFVKCHIHSLISADFTNRLEDEGLGMSSSDRHDLDERQRRAIKAAFPETTDDEIDDLEAIECPFTDINKLLYVIGCLDRYRRA